MDILFYPRINDGISSSGRCSLYCTITINQLRCVPFSTKIKILAKNWQPKKKTTNDEFSDTIRQELNRIENTLRRIKIDLENENQPITANIIKYHYFKLKGEQIQKQSKRIEKGVCLSDIFEILTDKKLKLGAKDSTKRHDKYLAKIFIDYSKSKGFKNIQPNQVDFDLVESYIEDFKKTQNYLNQSVRLLRNALDFAVRKKIIAFNPIKDIELMTPKKKPDETGLELFEVETLINAKIENENERKALDVFLFMCGTGVDFCDYNTITELNFDSIVSKKILRIDREKTNRYNSPTVCTQNAIVKDVALNILLKYGAENLPKFKYSSLINIHLQNIARREGIKTTLTTKRARKTFANISINYELHSDEQTAYQMGHTNTNQLKHYRKYSDKILSNLLN